MGLGSLMAALIEIELGRTFVQFKFGGDADNILFHANDEQKKRYLEPTISGERYSCFAITEPGAGSDARNIRTVRRARRRRVGDQRREDVHHRRRHRRLHAWSSRSPTRRRAPTAASPASSSTATRAGPPRTIPTMGEWGPASLSFQDVRVPHSAILGEEGRGFALAMKWIGKGRFMLPARALGACERLVEMAMEQAKQPGHLR